MRKGVKRLFTDFNFIESNSQISPPLRDLSHPNI